MDARVNEKSHIVCLGTPVRKPSELAAADSRLQFDNSFLKKSSELCVEMWGPASRQQSAKNGILVRQFVRCQKWWPLSVLHYAPLPLDMTQILMDTPHRLLGSHSPTPYMLKFYLHASTGLSPRDILTFFVHRPCTS